MVHTDARELARRGLGLAAGIVLGLVAAMAVLGSASAAAPFAPLTAPAGGQVWFVNNARDDGLAGYWKFDQVTGTLTINSAPLKFLANLSGGANLTTTIPPSVTIPNFSALHLDGVNGGVFVADDPELNVAPGSFSFAAWARRATVNSYDALYDSGTETNKWWVFIADNGVGKANRFGFGVRGLSEVYSTRSITDTNWHHLAVVKSGNGAANLVFYVDGVPSGVVTVTNVLTPAGSKHIGDLFEPGPGLSAFFGGDIDEVRLYKRALSAAEVLRLAAGRGCVTDGASWPTALTDLQCGIDLAGAGDEIWVAKTPIPYRPGTNRNASFRLVKPAGLFGGFAGAETAFGQRPPIDFSQALSTTLSGDLFGDDSGAANLGDNSFNVVATNMAVPAAALDGLVIRAGNSNNPLINLGQRNGGGLNISGSSPALSNLLFINNGADNRGGGLYATNQLTLTNVVFVTNSAAKGGGAFVEQDTFVDGGRFEGNAATIFDGGGLNVNATLILTASTFVSNRAAFSGGGATALTATVSNARFEQNQTSSFGGGGLRVNMTLTLVDSVFLSNTSSTSVSSGNGGGAQAGTALVSGGLFENNQAKSSAILGGGGGLFADNVFITGTRFIRNGTTLDGGGLTVSPFSSGSARLTGVVFISNTARNGGGFLATGVITANRIVMTANSTSGAGGAAMITGTLKMDGARLEGNFGSTGGALHIAGPTTISNTEFLANRTIFGNGGAIAVSNGGTRLTNILFVGNQAGGQGGAIQVDSSGLNLSQITAVQNSANVSGSVLFANNSGTQFANSIVWHNGAGAVGSQSSGISFIYNLGDAGLVNTGDIAANPIFVRDANPGDGDWTTLSDNDYGDLHLRLASPGIDAGDNTHVPFGLTLDLGGAPRLVDIPGVPDTGIGPAPVVDMGAYEAQLLNLFLPVIEK